MIKRWKIVQCSLCYKERMMRRVSDAGGSWWELPEGWVKINHKTHFCQDCNRAIHKCKTEGSFG